MPDDPITVSPGPQFRLAMLLAIVADALQLVIFPAFVEGALSPADRQRFDLHIGKCNWCKLYIDQIRLTIKAAGKLTEDSLEPRVKEELLAVFRGWKNG